MQIADINGWMYAALLPVPDDMFMTHIETADRALTERMWRTIAAEWHATERNRSRIHDALDLLAGTPLPIIVCDRNPFACRCLRIAVRSSSRNSPGTPVTHADPNASTSAPMTETSTSIPGLDSRRSGLSGVG